jgi:hypothetical protein
MSVEVTIVCDECSAIIVAASTAGEARREGLRDGAMVRRGTKDICMECVRRQERIRASNRGNR